MIIALAVIAAIVIIYMYSQRPMSTEIVVEQPGDWWGPWYGPWWWSGGDGGHWPYRPQPRPHPKSHTLGPGGKRPMFGFGSGAH
jgi:hypothetical protein